MVYELPASKLRKTSGVLMKDCKSTKAMRSKKTIIGQERAVSALEFGLRIHNPGFNIFVAGMPGTGRETAVRQFLVQEASTKPVPEDLCYVNNFKDPYRPEALSLPSGWGKKFSNDMSALEEGAHVEIARSFESDDYNNEKDLTVKKFQVEKDVIFRELSTRAREEGFLIQAGPMGILTVPHKDGTPIPQEELQKMIPEELEGIAKKQEKLQDELKAAIRQAKGIEKAAIEALVELDRKVGLFAVEHLMDERRETYKKFPKVLEYLEQVQEDMLDNLAHFRSDGSEEKQQSPVPGSDKRDLERKYKVNVLVDNSKLKGAPVVIATNPSFTNLFGKIEKEAHYGALVTDFTMIREGYFHQANGGYLIIPVDELLRNQLSWDGVKRTLRTREIAIEEVGERLGLVSTKSLRPEAIPLNMKVILLGTPSHYHLLYSLDEDFNELFKVKADFATTMVRNRKNIREYASFVSNVCDTGGLLHLDHPALKKIVEYGSRLAENQGKLSTRFGEISDIIKEANYYATLEEAELTSSSHVKKAIEAKFYRSNLYHERLKEYMQNGTIKIAVKDTEVGQINGLSVMSLGDVSFGQPSRITVSIGLGKAGIIDIERKANLGGPSHTKGVMILSGFLTERYAKEKPLSLSARLVFEQSYNGVDGDSASSTELYAILSNLSGVPIKQSIAVTGSVNQKGEVQAIGGINHKIEGFFEVCKLKGLTGEQGVMMPESNVSNLMLKEEVVSAVKKKKFHIWPVSTIDQGIEVLTGVQGGELKKDGSYPKGSINYLVDKRLQEMAVTLKEFNTGA